MNTRHSPLRDILVMFSLVFAGEAIFGLPFVIARIFRPTVLEVFGLDNLELGTAFSWYGMIAMAAYVPGGPIADRFSARRLMVVALLATGAGGIYFVSIPSLGGLNLLFAFWGLTTVLLFWAAMIRATKQLGGEHGQGRAFGILDGGRGLFAAVLATSTGFIFASLLPAEVESATLAQKTFALQRVIWIFTGLTAVAAVLVWFCVPESETTAVATSDDSQEELQPVAGDSKSKRKLSLQAIENVLRNPAIWLQGLIVVCAYTGYKGTDDFGLYAWDGFGFDAVQAARISTLAFWVRPIAAVGAGMLGDRIHASRAVLLCFGALIVGDLAIALGLLVPSAPWMLYMAVAGTSAAVFGLRGVYFALFDEAHVPPALIGTATGLVSVIGYTPDIFMGPLMGKLTVDYPGTLGHQFLFGVLAGFATIGFVATLLFRRVASRARIA